MIHEPTRRTTNKLSWHNTTLTTFRASGLQAGYICQRNNIKESYWSGLTDLGGEMFNRVSPKLTLSLRTLSFPFKEIDCIGRRS